MLLLVKNTNEATPMQLSTFEAIFRLSMEICDQYRVGCDPKAVIQSPVQLTARRAA
jgi:hypothetical protein